MGGPNAHNTECWWMNGEMLAYPLAVPPAPATDPGTITIKRNGRLVCSIPDDLDDDDKRKLCEIFHISDDVVFLKGQL